MQVQLLSLIFYVPLPFTHPVMRHASVIDVSMRTYSTLVRLTDHNASAYSVCVFDYLTR